MSAIDDYFALRQEIDDEVVRLETLHQNQLVCREGCVACCVDLTVFPVEFYAIVEAMGQDEVDRCALTLNPRTTCQWLKESLCQIYLYRPLICRTHGLAIAFLNDEGDGYNVSFCQKNFAGEALPDFGPDSTLNLDRLNDALFEINQQFLEEHPELSWAPTDRIALADLVKDLS